MKHKNHEESDLQCNFSHFRNYMGKFIIRFSYNIDTETFRSFLFQAWGAVVVAHHASPNWWKTQIFLNFKGIFLKCH